MVAFAWFASGATPVARRAVRGDQTETKSGWIVDAVRTSKYSRNVGRTTDQVAAVRGGSFPVTPTICVVTSVTREEIAGSGSYVKRAARDASRAAPTVCVGTRSGWIADVAPTLKCL